jgi:dihydroxyacid dehydratase/phosphogluconate dehydratase
MDAKTTLKSRLPGRHVTEGRERAPHRSYLDAMGLISEQMPQPLIGAASCWNEAVRCKDAFEAVGKHSVGPMSDHDLDDVEQVACPSAGAPAPCESRDKSCMAAGEQELLELDLRPRDIVTREALENAAATVAASGGSTDAALHQPAIADGIQFDLFDVAEVFKRTPYVADLKPAGRYVAKDMIEFGGIPLLIKTLLDHGYLHGDCMTVTGRTIAENLKSVTWNPHQDVVRPADEPITLGDAELAERRKVGKPRETFTSGYLWKYARQVGPAVDGGVTHAGATAEKGCHADA